MRKNCCLLMALLCLSYISKAQNLDSAAASAIELPNHLINQIGAEASSFVSKINSNSEKYLARFSREEKKLQVTLSKLDPDAAKQLFANGQSKYDKFLERVRSPLSKNILAPT